MKPIVAVLVLSGCLRGEGPPEERDRHPGPLSRPGGPPPDRVALAETRPLLVTGTVRYEGRATGRALVVVVDEAGAGLPPLAVAELPPGPLPMTFTISDADLVPTGAAPRAVPPSVAVTARLDADGDVATTDPAEPIARLQVPAHSPGLVMTLAGPR